LQNNNKNGVGVVVPNRGFYIFGGFGGVGPGQTDRLASINGAWYFFNF